MSSSEEPYPPPIPKSPGTYALMIRLRSSQNIQIGRLGQFHFPSGTYLYIGSALGPGGLAGRLNRHLRSAKAGSGVEIKRHWHIDYLWPHARIEAILYTQQKGTREHEWASLAGQLPGAAVPALRFGASDCRCASHLFHLPPSLDWTAFERSLREHLPTDPLVSHPITA
jgi:Uri superfamily endonuclease